MWNNVVNGNLQAVTLSSSSLSSFRMESPRSSVSSPRQVLVTAADNLPTVSVILPINSELRPTKKPAVRRKAGKSPPAVVRMIALCLLLLLLIICCVVVETVISSFGLLSVGHNSVQDQQYHQEIVDIINNLNGSLWKAKYNRFASKSARDQLDFEGLAKIAQQNRNMDKEALYGDTVEHLRLLKRTLVVLPRQFDARVRWPQCWTVHQVPNQGGCGSCWSMAATAVMSDRICIAYNGTRQPSISAQDLTTCCSNCGGCQGSHWALAAFTFWKTRGLVTGRFIPCKSTISHPDSGGGYGTFEGCKPYAIAADCGNPCSVTFYDHRRTAKCQRNCQRLYDKDYEDDKHRAQSVYWVRADKGSSETQPIVLQTIRRIVSSEEADEMMKKELYLHGPFLACFTVYEDFQHYSSGIYQPFLFYDRDSNKELYGHCAKLLGWGDENGVNYWLYMNTWGREWGENGFFRIVMSEAPEEAVAGLPD